jgi:hypothetical protein
MEAIKAIRGVERGASLVGPAEAQFFELGVAPNVEDMRAAVDVASVLLATGIGVKVSVQWPFEGSRRWAVWTGRTRVANRGA